MARTSQHLASIYPDSEPLKITTQGRQDSTFDPDILGQSQANLTMFRRAIRIASHMSFSAIDIPVTNIWIHNRLGQHLVFAASNRGDASNLSISSGDIEDGLSMYSEGSHHHAMENGRRQPLQAAPSREGDNKEINTFACCYFAPLAQCFHSPDLFIALFPLGDCAV
jgi:hypothetical protein